MDTTPDRTPSEAGDPASPRSHTDGPSCTEDTRGATAREEFDRFLDEHREELFHYAEWLCGDNHLADDLVQDASLATWRRVKTNSVTVDDIKKQYLKVAVKHAFIDHLRKLQAETRRDHGVAVTLEEILKGDPGERWLDGGEFSQAREILSPRHWEIFVLTEAYGFKASEIAERLGLAKGTVQNYLSSARKQIQAAFA